MTISNLMKMAESSPKGQEAWLDEEKLLVMSNFSFSHSVFKGLELQTRKNKGFLGKGLMHRPDPWYQARHHVIMDKKNPILSN